MIAPPQAARFSPKNCFSPLGGLEAVSGGGPCPAEPARNTGISQRCNRLRESSVREIQRGGTVNGGTESADLAAP